MFTKNLETSRFRNIKVASFEISNPDSRLCSLEVKFVSVTISDIFFLSWKQEIRLFSTKDSLWRFKRDWFSRRKWISRNDNALIGPKTQILQQKFLRL